MLKIKVRGEANAQALFDVLHGCNVIWREPKNSRATHVLTVANPGEGLPAHLKCLFPDMRFTVERSATLKPMEREVGTGKPGYR